MQPSLFQLDPPLPAWFPAIAGHFSLEPFNILKPDDDHLTYGMVPSLLHTVHSHMPLRSSPPPTAPLSALIPFPDVLFDPQLSSRGMKHAPPVTPPGSRRQIRRILSNCHVVTYN